jgi:tRNA A-37 threonylcarbamoyl transferase component Bud32
VNRGIVVLQKMDDDAYQALRRGAQVLEQDHHGEKLLVLNDGTFLKLFRVKRLISSARLVSHAVRFARNAEALHRHGFPTVEVLEVARVPSIRRTAVRYRPLKGRNLRDLAADTDVFSAAHVESLARFVARLHERGVYFHSLHLGNILQLEDGRLALIDISDMTVSGERLSTSKRVRNLRHLLRYKQDMAALERFGEERFPVAYVAAAQEESGIDPEALGAPIESLIAQLKSGAVRTKN